MVMETAAANVPRPVVPGEEMERLARFFVDVTWEGTIVEGGMGPGTPEMTAAGIGVHRQIQEGRWIIGDYRQDQYLLDGTYVLTWELHWVVGWDPAAGEYRATLADNYGRSDVMRGVVEGDRLIFETLGEQEVKIRLVWDAADPAELGWRNEMSVFGSPYSLVEEYRMRPLGAPAAAASA
jgi:hypothetical protein